MIECSEADIKRFMKHVDKLPCGCWFWTGATSKGKGNRKPYGTFWVNRKVGRVRAHRFACEVIGGMGELPRGHDRDHTCRFSLCVNPECIEYVTKAVNQERKLSGHSRFNQENEHADRGTVADGPVGRTGSGRLQILYEAGPRHEGVPGAH